VRCYADLKLSMGYLEGAGEISQSGHGPVRQRSSLLNSTELVQYRSQFRNDETSEPSFFRSLDKDRQESYFLCDLPDSHEEDGLAHTSESQEHDALGMPPCLYPLERDTRTGDDVVSTCESGGPRACTRGEWVLNRIHDGAPRAS